MASNSFLGEGSNINRPPSFNGEYYNFWKIRMKIFIESQDLEIWNVIENGPFVPTHVISGVSSEKPKSAWNEDDKRRVQYDLKAKNILTSALGMDEFFRVSNCKSSKEMWDTLETTHEGTDEVKRSRLNTLSQEYELFRMLPNEKIIDMQKRFIHLTNHLIALGKDLSTSDLNMKILRSLSRVWQPKVTAISEKKSLSTMSLATLFGKLQEHELELGRLEQNEEVEKKEKSIALKAKAKERTHEETSDEDNGDMNLLVKRFRKFLKRNKNFKSSKFDRRNANVSNSQNLTCFECGKVGHVKADCPTLNFKKKESSNKYDKKSKRAYIDDSEESTSSDSDSDENVNIALMASHYSDDESNEVSNSTIKISYDELQNAFDELHDEFVKLSRKYMNQKKTIIHLESLNKRVIEISPCEKCIIHENKINELNDVIFNYEKRSKSLDMVLSEQRPLNDKRGLGFSSSHSGNNTKTKFVKSYVNQKQTMVYKNVSMSHSHTKFNNPFQPFRKPRPACFYCNLYGHTPNACYIKNIGVPCGRYKWVEKGTNIEGPKSHWVPSFIT